MHLRKPTGVDPEERRWRRLPEVHFRLEKDEDGYPPKDWESLKAEPTDGRNIYRIKSVPFFDRRIAYHDEVLTCTSPEGWFPVFETLPIVNALSSSVAGWWPSGFHQRL